MAVNRSFADIMAEWDALLRAREQGLLPDSSRLERIAVLKEQAMALTRARWFHESQRRRAVVELDAVIREGLDEARDLRAGLRSALGSRSEDLVAYDLKPLREGARRRRSQKRDPASLEADAETPEAP